ncbi:alpha-E domain-containing protein [Polynucleobacter necessarius]|uniref:alpha-E domain-containing protein n=1 Tax=Polynucleobacter necessarius TaxID=576610 RepID=UPI0022B25135|nr:alpha-E domain-containing protein [Polynucleobacter necessarius]
MQRGGSSADVWVQNTPSTQDQGQQKHQSIQTPEKLIRKRLVTSRAAENLYWFGRYTERSENILRLAKLYLEKINSEYTPSRPLWTWLENLCHFYGLVPEGVPSNFDQEDTRHRIFERTLIHSLNASENVTSIGFNLNAMKPYRLQCERAFIHRAMEHHQSLH